MTGKQSESEADFWASSRARATGSRRHSSQSVETTKRTFPLTLKMRQVRFSPRDNHTSEANGRQSPRVGQLNTRQ